MEETATKNPGTNNVQVTIEQLRRAVAEYDLLLPSEVAPTYEAMLASPEVGLRIAQGLQQAMLAASQGKLPRDRVLDAAVIPAFLLGLLVGRQQS